MRQLIESLSPEASRIRWEWIGGVFAFYVAVMTVGAVVFATHHSAKRLTLETAAAAAAQDDQRTVEAAAMARGQMARDH